MLQLQIRGPSDLLPLSSVDIARESVVWFGSVDHLKGRDSRCPFLSDVSRVRPSNCAESGACLAQETPTLLQQPAEDLDIFEQAKEDSERQTKTY